MAWAMPQDSEKVKNGEVFHSSRNDCGRSIGAEASEVHNDEVRKKEIEAIYQEEEGKETAIHTPRNQTDLRRVPGKPLTKNPTSLHTIIRSVQRFTVVRQLS
jgi:hypothetical protein